MSYIKFLPPPKGCEATTDRDGVVGTQEGWHRVGGGLSLFSAPTKRLGVVLSLSS